MDAKVTQLIKKDFKSVALVPGTEVAYHNKHRVIYTACMIVETGYLDIRNETLERLIVESGIVGDPEDHETTFAGSRLTEPAHWLELLDSGARPDDNSRCVVQSLFPFD
ncbi:hypothetical protein AcV7_004758 [Taiwanofungus camphoratus]|nr:hypothetical protein AcV7_004758 [Antrodia cinnamomea]